MTDHLPDPTLDRAIATLSQLPEVDPAALRRVVEAAAAARVNAADEEPPRREGRYVVRTIVIPTLVAGGLVAAALVGVFVARRGAHSAPPPTTAAAIPAAAPAAAAAAALTNAGSPDGGSSLAVPRQFVFARAGARRVSLVGDFNGWRAGATPMVQPRADGLWSVIVPITPGRHLYGFMVDDSVFVLDPTAPKARDPDLGAEGSVVIVGRP